MGSGGTLPLSTPQTERLNQSSSFECRIQCLFSFRATERKKTGRSKASAPIQETVNNRGSEVDPKKKLMFLPHLYPILLSQRL